MGYIIGSVAFASGKEGNNMLYNFAGILVSSVVMIAGYYATEGILYGNWISPATSIPGNIVQLVFGCSAIFLTPLIKKALKAGGLL